MYIYITVYSIYMNFDTNEYVALIPHPLAVEKKKEIYKWHQVAILKTWRNDP